jgi:hypothetical protein
LIENLNPAFLYDSRDEVNIYDTFFITNNTNYIEFTPKKQSLLRTSAHSYDMAMVTLSGYENNVWKTLKYSTNGDTIYTDALKANTKYRLLITIGSDEDFEQCKLVTLQLSFRPLDSIEMVQHNSICPATGTSVLPSFPPLFGGSVGLPYISQPDVHYYSFRSFVGSDGVIAQFNFNTSEGIILEGRIGSHFILDNYYLEIVFLSQIGNGERPQTQRSNSISLEQQHILAYLSPGFYQLLIKSKVDTEHSSGASIYTQCSQFSFDVSVLAAATWFQTHECKSGIIGQDIPNTLNSMYYLGNNGRVETQSDSWWFPDEALTHGIYEKYITFNVKVTSLIRVYVEEHLIDVDLYLYNSSSVKVAEGLNLMGEESFVAEILPGDYSIKLVFINYGHALQACPRFNMEIAINSVFNLPYVKDQCTKAFNHSSLFPQLPKSFSALDRMFMMNNITCERGERERGDHERIILRF